MGHGVLPVEYVGYTGEPLWCPMGTPGGLIMVWYASPTSSGPTGSSKTLLLLLCFDLSHVFDIFCRFFANAIPSVTFSMDLAILLADFQDRGSEIDMSHGMKLAVNSPKAFTIIRRDPPPCPSTTFDTTPKEIG